METGKPPIAILMALYNPRMDWLREQLESLNAQTYPNLRLYIRDDCSPSAPFGEIEALVRECITVFPYELSRNAENLGSNGTFEELTRQAQGEYFAYCDQDDVWLPEKLETLQARLEQSGALLACSDMLIIDGQGRQTAESITQVRRHHVFHSGAGLAPGLIFHNFVVGCTMLVRAQQAKAAVPFCPHMVHDHYLALWCAGRGAIESVETPLIRYRIHGGNQTALLAGVTDKESYGRVRIDAMLHRVQWLEENFPCEGEMRETLRQGAEWARARKENWEHGRGKATVWKYRAFSRIPSLFEIVGRGMPEWLFRKCLRLGQENKI